MSDDESQVLDLLLTALSGGAMAGAIARHTTWASHGSDRRLDRALQALRRAGRVRYVKGLGWQAVTS